MVLPAATKPPSALKSICCRLEARSTFLRRVGGVECRNISISNRITASLLLRQFAQHIIAYLPRQAPPLEYVQPTSQGFHPREVLHLEVIPITQCPDVLGKGSQLGSWSSFVHILIQATSLVGTGLAGTGVQKSFEG